MAKAPNPAPKRKRKAKRQPRPLREPKVKVSRGAFYAQPDDMLPRIGRPSFKATDRDREWVRAVSGLGMSQDEMAMILRTTRVTLVKHFRVDIDEGRAEAMTQVASALFKKATAKEMSGASVRAAEIFLKRDARWLEARRPKDEDDEAGDNELLVKGGLPERELREVETAEEEATRLAKEAATAPPAPDKAGG